MKRQHLFILIVALALLPGVGIPASATHRDSLQPGRLPGNSCSPEAIPEVILLAEGDVLEAGLLYLVKGPATAIDEAFSEMLWWEPFGETAHRVALVRPAQDTPWPETRAQAALSPAVPEAPDSWRIHNAWRIVAGWREPFVMYSPLEDPMDVHSVGTFDAGQVILAQALDHLNHVHNGQDRHAWIYLVRSDGTERMLQQLAIADPVLATIITPEQGEVQIRTRDSTIWWTQCLPAPSIDLTKSANPVRLPEPGGSVQFTVRVANTSPFPLTLTSLTDNVFGNISQQANPLITSTSCTVPKGLAVGASYQCQFSAEIWGDPGETHEDIVAAVARDPYDREVRATDSAQVEITDILPQIQVTHTANPTSIPEPGGAVDFGVRVDNPGPEAVVLTSLTNDIYGNIADPNAPAINSTTCTLPQPLPVGGAYLCTFNADVLGQPGFRQVDTVTGIAYDDDGNQATDSDDAEVEITDLPSSIQVIKVANPTSVPEPGADVEFLLTIRNTSQVDSVTINGIIDDQFGDLGSRCDATPPATLRPGETIACSFSLFVGGRPGDTHTNIATAFGRDDDGQPVSGIDTETVIIEDVPSAIEVIKTATPYWIYFPGDDVTFRFVVRNLSAADTVTIDTFVDSVYGDLDGQGSCSLPQTLPVGGSFSCYFMTRVTGDAETTHTNVATASGIDDDGSPVSDDDFEVITIAAIPSTVDLQYFTASVLGEQIVLEWETSREEDSWGFNLHRAPRPNFDEAEWLHFEAARGPNQNPGKYYRYDDNDVAIGQEYYYWLEYIDLINEVTYYGPMVALVPYRTYLPIASP